MWKVVLVHLPVIPSEEMEQWFYHQKTDSADGVREGIVRGTWNILRIFSETAQSGRIYVIQGIEPLVQDVLPEQLVSGLVIQSRGGSP